VNLDALVIVLLLTGWALCSGLVWLLLAASRRGRDALITLPAALLVGWMAALLLPVFGFRDGRALALSFPFAALGGFVGIYAVLAVRAMMKRRPASPERAPGQRGHPLDQH
jgi:hypothetical protein